MVTRLSLKANRRSSGLPITADEVAASIAIIEALGKALYAGVLKNAV